MQYIVSNILASEIHSLLRLLAIPTGLIYHIWTPLYHRQAFTARPSWWLRHSRLSSGRYDIVCLGMAFGASFACCPNSHPEAVAANSGWPLYFLYQQRCLLSRDAHASTCAFIARLDASLYCCCCCCCLLPCVLLSTLQSESGIRR